MNRIMPDGSLALVQPCTEYGSPSDLYVVAVGSTDATVKRVSRRRSSITLLPDSSDPSFQPMVYAAADTDEVTLIGRVVRFLAPEGSDAGR